jgi:hypothetical protein
MTKHQSKQVEGFRAAGWPFVYVERAPTANGGLWPRTGKHAMNG